jgi:ribosomal protein S19
MARSLYKPVATFFNRKALLVSKKPGWLLFDEGCKDPLMSVSSSIGSFFPRIGLSTLAIFRFLALRFKRFASSKSAFLQTESGIFVNKSILKLFTQLKTKFTTVLVVFSNTQIITPSLCGKRVLAYNGMFLNLLSIRRSMIGFSLRHFIRTKRTGSVIHTLKRKKGKKK